MTAPSVADAVAAIEQRSARRAGQRHRHARRGRLRSDPPGAPARGGARRAHPGHRAHRLRGAEDRRRTLHAGYDSHVAKPVETSAFAPLIASLLPGSAAHEEPRRAARASPGRDRCGSATSCPARSTGPRELVRLAGMAEEHGFSFALISDHFHPWTDRQGQSPFVWSVIGGIAQVTRAARAGHRGDLPDRCGSIPRSWPRPRPRARLMDGRFFLGVGTGENLNEHILGQGSDGAGNGFNRRRHVRSGRSPRAYPCHQRGRVAGLQQHVEDPVNSPSTSILWHSRAQTTVQRWFADPTLNLAGKDRTLGTVFSHDHFGPSTHQQAGLYAGLVTEPENSIWKHNETGQVLGGRFDGGPTTWQAVIQTQNVADSYREFLVEFADYTLAYKAGGGVNGAGHPIPDPANAINPPARGSALPINIQKADECPGGVPLPCPEAVSAADPGTMVVNYRNEPVALVCRIQEQHAGCG